MKRIMIVVLSLILLSGCSSSNADNSALLKISDTAISKEEYMIYLDEAVANFEAIGGSQVWDTDMGEKTAEQTAKDMALNSLITIKISAMKADEYGFTLTDDELKAVEENVNSFVESLGDGGTDINLVRTVMEDKAKYNKIRESTYASYEPEDEELAEYFTDYYDVYEEMYTVYTLDTIMVEDKSAGEEVISRFNAGEDFRSLAEEYEIDDSVGEEGWMMEVYKAELENAFSTSVDLEVGEITEVLSVGEENYLMLLTDKYIPNEDEVKGYIRDEFAYYEQQNIFNNEFEKWKAEYTIEVDEEMYEGISIGKGAE